MLSKGYDPVSNLQQDGKDHGVVAKSHPCVRVLQQQIFQEMQESMTTFVRGEQILKPTIDQFVLNFFKSQANG